MDRFTPSDRYAFAFATATAISMLVVRLLGGATRLRVVGGHVVAWHLGTIGKGRGLISRVR